MQLAMIGLGRMGANMVRRLLRGGHACVVHDLNRENVRALEKEGAAGAATLEEVAAQLSPPRTVWVMVPAGPPTDATLEHLARVLEKGDVAIDGGNSHFRDDVRRARALGERGIHFLDVGTSGGVWGLERGYCLMIGGDAGVVDRLAPIFRTLAPGRGAIPRTEGRAAGAGTAEEGFLHCGPAGAGHFVKMIHNGIEYGLMQAYAEGFDILAGAASDKLPEGRRYDLPLGEIAELWRRGSVVSSWLLDLTAAALVRDPALKDFTGSVQDSGEGRWTIEAAIEEAVPANVISAALYARFRSRRDHTFADKLLSAMRYQFGGHTEKPGAAGGPPRGGGRPGAP
jgi:6-phosphogluconate dehydrogenase